MREMNLAWTSLAADHDAQRIESDRHAVLGELPRLVQIQMLYAVSHIAKIICH